MATVRFFQPDTVSVIGDSDQFHAIAVAVIDHFQFATRANEVTLKKILERFFTLYPKFITIQPYLTPDDRMQMLLNSSRKSEIVNCLADVLRQLTVDEIYEHPAKYQEAYYDLQPDTLQSHLRQPRVSLPATSLSALTECLGITLVLLYIEHGKELRKREIYTNDSFNAPKFEAVIQVQGDQYIPRVKNKADFAFVGQLPVYAKKAIDETVNQSTNLVDMFQEIEEENSELLRVFETHRRRLKSMVDAGELDKNDLLQLYIKYLPKTIGPLNSTLGFYYRLEKLDRKPVVVKDPLSSDEYVTQLLVDALAARVTGKQMTLDQLFESGEYANATPTRQA